MASATPMSSVSAQRARQRDELQSMVRDYFAAGSLLESPAAIEATMDQPAERIGNLIGPYKLLQQIGEGGMGVVYMAEQHEPVRRMVAVKIIKPGLDQPAGPRPLRGRTPGSGADGSPQHRQGARRRHHRERPPLLCHGTGQGYPHHPASATRTS